MPRFSFSGFPSGSLVTLSAAQGTLSDSGSVQTWGQGNTAVLDITPQGAGLSVAPAVFWFEATPVSGFGAIGGPAPGEVHDPAFHDITYVWEFDDPGTFQTTLNIPTAWNNRNVAYGRKVAHVFSDPGTYTVRCWAVEMATGKTAEKTVSVVVSDPAAVFPATQTILYDPAGVGDEANYPGANVQTTYAGCIAARQSLGTTVARILLKRGETITDLSATGNNNPFWWPISNFRLGAWGTGAKPIVGPDPSLQALFSEPSNAGVTEQVYYDLDLRGEWDSTTETGRSNKPFRWAVNSERLQALLYMCHRCDFSGFASVETVINNGVANTLPIRTIFNDVSVTNFQYYGIYNQTVAGQITNALAIIGSSLFQDPDALSGGGQTGFYNNEGPLRITEVSETYLDCLDLFSRAGWSGLGNVNGEAVTGENAALRLQTIGRQGTENYVNRISCEGLAEIHRDATGGGNTKAVNTIIDKMLHVVGSTAYEPKMEVQAGGVTLRNYLSVMLDVPRYAGATPRYFIGFNPPTDQTNLGSPVNIVNSTFLDLRSDANANPFDQTFDRTRTFGPNIFTNVTEENIVDHAPNRSAPYQVVLDGPLDELTAIPGFLPRHKGVRYNFKHQTGSLGAPVAPGQSMPEIPYSQITTDLVGQTGGAATTQVYWQALVGIDDLHVVVIGGTRYFAADGDMSITITATGIIVNNTGTATWPAAGWDLRLDRKSLIPAMDTTFRSDNQVVPLARPQTNSIALNTGDTGLTAYDDLLGAVRPGLGSPDHLDMPRPISGNERGAILEQ